MEKILVSACLLGETCKYSGGSNYHEGVADFFKRNEDWIEAVPVCPEVAGGLSTPRDPAEIRDGFVITKAGADVTAQFEAGAGKTGRLAGELECKRAILKERSPSCGSGEVYDGTFSATVVRGDGRTAALLKKMGIEVLGESQVELLRCKLPEIGG